MEMELAGGDGGGGGMAQNETQTVALQRPEMKRNPDGDEEDG